MAETTPSVTLPQSISAPLPNPGGVEGKNGKFSLADFVDGNLAADKGSSNDGDKNGQEKETSKKAEGLLTEEVKKEPSEASTEESAEDDDLGSDSKEEVKAAPPAAKPIKIKVGETEVELTPDTIIPTKVEGEVQEVPLRELLRNYAGKIPLEKRYEELSKEKKAFVSEKQQTEARIAKDTQRITDITSNLKKVAQLVPTNVFGAVEALATIGGIDPYVVHESIIKQSEIIASELAKLSPDERSAVLASKRREYESKRADAERQSLESEKRNIQEEKLTVDLAKYTTNLQLKHKISDDELAQAWEVLEKDIPKEMSAKQTADAIVDYILLGRDHSKAIKVISAVDTSLTKDYDFVKKIRKVVQDEPDFTESDLIDIVKAATGVDNKVGDSSEDLSEQEEDKVATRQGATKSPTVPKTPQKREEPKARDRKAYLSYRDIIEDFAS